MTWIWRILFFVAGEYLKGQLVTRAKRKGVIAYLHALQGTRRAVVIALAAFFIFHGILLAGFGALVTGMMLLNLEQRTMLEILFSIFLAMFLLPLLALMWAMSERLWYKASGAEKMVEEVTGHKEERKAA